MVCDGSPQKLFLGLVGELVFCDICQVPVGDLDKHCQESHDGIIPEDKLQLELDHILPLCGPGHVEKNLMTTTVQIIWNLIGLDEFSKWCDYMGEGQKQYLYNCGDHHKTADFIIIVLQTLAREMCFQFMKGLSLHPLFSPDWGETFWSVPVGEKPFVQS